uniref:Uncharacterized protein n=1 Tax=Acrobeloides nanus TaxID=290746 RepID=A0A914D2I8_9BILA
MFINSNNMAPKNFDNELRKRSPISTLDLPRPSSAPGNPSPGYFDAPAKQDLYEGITPMSHYDSYLTTPKLVYLSDLQNEPLP